MGKIILFCNIGWMEKYQGLSHQDKIIGGGSYVREKGRGDEVCNFVEHNGYVYGHVQPPGNHIQIEKLGASLNDNSINKVNLIWTATRPEGGRVIIGWYKDATVYRNYQFFDKQPSVHKSNGIKGYRIKSLYKNAKLLSKDERVLHIPRGKGGMGQSNVWYAKDVHDHKWLSRVKQFIDTGKLPKTRTIQKDKLNRKKQDQEKKVKVERNSINSVVKYYEAKSYSVRSVEKDNLGWDLEATNGKINLLLEVKGLSSNIPVIELTPNEYFIFKQMKPSYRLCIVTNALTYPKLAIYSFSQEEKKWLSDTSSSDQDLMVKKKISAIIKCN